MYRHMVLTILELSPRLHIYIILELSHLDIKNAFLCGDVQEKMYML